MTMTLEQAIGTVRGLMRVHPKGVSVRDAWEIVEAHLSQPAQAVDVGALTALVQEWRTRVPATAGDSPRVLMREWCADELEATLTRALSTAQAGEFAATALANTGRGPWTDAEIEVERWRLVTAIPAPDKEGWA